MRSVKEQPAADAAPPLIAAKEASVADGSGDAATAPDGDTLLFNLAPLPPDAPFQGMMSLQARFGNGFSPAAVYVFTFKGKKVRWDLIADGGKGEILGYRVYDGEEHKFYTVAPALKSVLVTDEASAGASIDAGASWTWKPFTPEPHGMASGYPCDQRITHDDEIEYGVCVAKGLPQFPMQDLTGTLAHVVPFNATLLETGGFPVDVVMRRLRAGDGGAARSMAGSLQVMRIERGKVPENAFDIPASLPRVPAASLDFGRRARR